LQITNEALRRTIEYTNKMLTVLVQIQENNGQARVLKNIVLNPGWFDEDRTKFKNWWKEMRLFLKSNRIIAILACLRGDIAGIYAQKKLDELDKETEIQDWDDFVQEIKRTFSNKTKAADVEWKIKIFKQEKKTWQTL